MKINTIAARASRLAEIVSYEKEFEQLMKRSKATRDKIARALKGKSKSKETRKRMSEARFRYLARVRKQERHHGRSR